MTVFGVETLAAAEGILAIGAHPDDIEIGCGATLLSVQKANPAVDLRWLVLTGDDVRTGEATSSAELYFGAATPLTGLRFRDGYLPYEDPAAVKDALVEHREGFTPDIVFAPRPDDAHQDHRFIGELVGQVYRRQTLLHYEIAKYDGDLAPVNLYVAVTPADVDTKVERLFAAFPSQKTKPWFDEASFRGLMRLRGVEAASPTGYAEGFLAPKLVFG